MTIVPPLRTLPAGATAPQETGLAISCSNVSKIFEVIDGGTYWRVLFGLAASPRQVTALRRVSLEIPKGKVAGVMGRNGAGKSTLLRTLAGIYAPTAGKVLVSGEAAGIFELGGGGNKFLTGREYAARYLSLRGAAAPALNGLVEDIRDFSELGEFFDRRIHTYSTGMAARLYFATATARRHDVYLIDEILSVGDEHFRAKSWTRIRDRLRDGASGLLVTHDWSAVMRLCEVCYVLDESRIVAGGPPDSIVPQYLKLARPAADRARFSDALPGEVRGSSGEDWRMELVIEANDDVVMELAFSIEHVCPGVDWEIMILSRPEPVGHGPGRFRVGVSVPELPLPPGDYCLNLFLTVAAEGNRPQAGITLDARSWTHGNGIRMAVDGAPRSGRIATSVGWHHHA